MDATMEGYEAWREEGSYMRVGMNVEQVADAVAFALTQPRGVAVDLLEVRPQRRAQKA